MPFPSSWTIHLEEPSALAIDIPGHSDTQRIDLEICLGVSENKFVWDSSGFVSKAVPNSIQLNGSVLSADFLDGDQTVSATVDLSENITVDATTGSITWQIASDHR
jgi:hypothetical protein